MSLHAAGVLLCMPLQISLSDRMQIKPSLSVMPSRWKKTFSATEFIKLLEPMLSTSDQRGEVHTRLVKAILLPEDELPPDPISSPAQAVKQPAPSDELLPHASAPAPLPAETVVFLALVQHVCEQLRRQDAKRIESLPESILKALQASKLSKKVKQEIRAWVACLLTGQESHVKMSKQSLLGAIQLLYVWSCEAYGPTLTDKAFGHAIRVTAQLPEAAVFSPRHLF